MEMQINNADEVLRKIREDKRKAWLKAKESSQVSSTRKEGVADYTSAFGKPVINTHKRKTKRRSKII